MNHNISIIEAACIGRNDIIKILLENGADINQKDENGYNAIHHAVQNGNFETIKLLLDNKIEFTFDQTILERIKFNLTSAAINQKYGYDANYEFLYPISRIKNLETIEYLIKLLEENENTTSLFEAVKRRNYILLKSILLNENIDINIDDRNNALEQAIYEGNLKFVILLMENNAKITYSKEELIEIKEVILENLKFEDNIKNLGFQNIVVFSYKDKLKTINYVLENYDKNYGEDPVINV